MGQSLEALTWKLVNFRNARNWEQFHTPRNLILALSGEVGELASIVQWKTDKELSQLREDDPTRHNLSLELADVLSYLLLIAESLEIDLDEAIEEKILLNEERYPVQKSFGKSNKYSELD